MVVNWLLVCFWLFGVELFYVDFFGQVFGCYSYLVFVIGLIFYGVGGYQCCGWCYVLLVGILLLMNLEELYIGYVEFEWLVYWMFYVEEMCLFGLFGCKQLLCGFGELNLVDDGSVVVGLVWLVEDFQCSDVLGLESCLLVLFEQVFVCYGGLCLVVVVFCDGGIIVCLCDYLEVYVIEVFGLD